MKSKQTIQITLATIAVVTLMTIGIVYANDDIMTEIEKAIKSLQYADKQQDKQIKKLNKQISELQQENEKQQKQIKRLKDFRGDTHSEMDIILNELIVRPVSEYALITLDKTTITQGDYLEFIVNLEPILERQSWYDETTTIDSMEFMIVEQDLFEIRMEYYSADSTQSEPEGWIIEAYDEQNEDMTYKVKSEYTNYTTFTIKIPIPNDNKIGIHNVHVTPISVDWNFKESEYTLDLVERYPNEYYHYDSKEIVRTFSDEPCDYSCVNSYPEMRIDLQYIMMP